MSGNTPNGLMPKAVNPLYSDPPSQPLYGQGGMWSSNKNEELASNFYLPSILDDIDESCAGEVNLAQ